MFIHFVEAQQPHVASSSNLYEKIQRFAGPLLDSG
jgi:hypothetical protein